MPPTGRSNRRRLLPKTTCAETLEYRLCLSPISGTDHSRGQQEAESVEPAKKDMHGWDTLGMHAKTNGLHISASPPDPAPVKKSLFASSEEVAAVAEASRVGMALTKHEATRSPSAYTIGTKYAPIRVNRPENPIPVVQPVANTNRSNDMQQRVFGIFQPNLWLRKPELEDVGSQSQRLAQESQVHSAESTVGTEAASHPTNIVEAAVEHGANPRHDKQPDAPLGDWLESAALRPSLLCSFVALLSWIGTWKHTSKSSSQRVEFGIEPTNTDDREAIHAR